MKRILSLSLLLFSIVVHAQKKPLDHTVYDQWQSIRDVVLSNDHVTCRLITGLTSVPYI